MRKGWTFLKLHKSVARPPFIKYGSQRRSGISFLTDTTSGTRKNGRLGLRVHIPPGRSFRVSEQPPDKVDFTLRISRDEEGDPCQIQLPRDPLSWTLTNT